MTEPWRMPVGSAPRVTLGRFSLRRSVAIALAALLVVLSPFAVSYLRALTVPGGGSFGVRTVEWVRQSGGASLVAGVENFWYGHHQPPRGGKPAGGLSAASVDPRAVNQPGSAPTVSAAEANLKGSGPPPSVVPVAFPALPGEGQWQAIGTQVNRQPAMYAAYLRPDDVHTSLTAALVWMDPALATLHLVAGSVQPGGTGWPDMAPLDPGLTRQLLATFNSGFRLPDARGGYYSGGMTARPLVQGAASLVIRKDGSVALGQWGPEVTMTAEVAAVRQNLVLIVDNSTITSDVYQSSTRAWGATVGNQVFVWRSGLGITASGALVYAAGPGLTVASLATLLIHAGAVRAMEMDINSAWVSFVSYNLNAGASADASNASLLLPDMTGGPGRFLGPSTRDFLAFVAR